MSGNDPQPLEPNAENRNRDFRARKADVEARLSEARMREYEARDAHVAAQRAVDAIRQERDNLYVEFGKGRLNETVTNGEHFPLLGGRSRRRSSRRRNTRRRR